MNLTKFYINGEFTDPSSNETLGIINPATEEEIGIVALGSIEDVDRAVYSARKAFSVSSKLSKTDRLDILKTVRENYKKRFNDLSEAIRLEMGAPIKLAEGAQAATGLGHLKTAIRVLENHEFEYKHGDYIVREEPIGVCGLITPWNWPINQIVSKVAPAFAAGCTVILKPSEIAPLSAMIVAEIMHESKIPAGMFNLVNGLGNIVGEAMSAHKNIDMISFTGSTRGGVAVATASAATVKRVSQELGGKSANIILDDADFNQSVAGGVTGCFMNSGQSCNAPTRMLVPADRQDEAVAIAKATAEATIVGDPKEVAAGGIGPVVSEVQFNKIQGLIEKGIEEGATLVAGGPGKPEGFNAGYYVKPTIFSDVSNDMTIAREEIFGPVLSILPYKNEDDAISIANDTEYGLSGYVSGSQEKAQKFAEKFRSGNVHVNGAGPDFNAPFGGYKKSGNGREWGDLGFEEFLEIKAILGYNAA